MAAGWFARIDRAIGRIVPGLFLIALGSGLLWWNEGRLAAAYRAIDAEQARTPELSAEKRAPAKLEGRLVQVHGLAEGGGEVRDPDFGIGAGSGALRLERRVQCYGATWVEAHPADADACLLPELGSRTFTAETTRFGAYRLPPELAGQIGGARPLPPTLADAVRERLAGRMQEARRVDAAGAGRSALIHVINDSLYLGRDPRAPQPGDMRISFLAVPPTQATVLARLNGDTFAPYPAEDGASIFAVVMSRASMAPGFAAERERSRLEAWALRGAGAASVVFGLKLLAGPLAALASPVPILGAMVGAGTGLVCTLLGLAWSLAVAALAWLRFRPPFAALMLATAAALLFAAYRRGKKAAATLPPGARKHPSAPFP